MRRYEVDWALKARVKLKLALGWKCAVCGTRRRLEFDCIVPQGHKHHAIGVIGRTCFYRAQNAVGNLQLLCRKHHLVKTLQETHES